MLLLVSDRKKVSKIAVRFKALVHAVDIIAHANMGSMMDIDRETEDWARALMDDFVMTPGGKQLLANCEDKKELKDRGLAVLHLEDALFTNWFNRNIDNPSMLHDPNEVQVRDFLVSVMIRLRGLSCGDALELARVVVWSPYRASRRQNTQTQIYINLVLLVSFVYIVIRIQSCWRGFRLRRAVAEHVNVRNLLWVSTHRIYQFDAPTNDLIQRFVGKLLSCSDIGYDYVFWEQPLDSLN